MNARLTLRCPAKVNLALAVGPPDPATGYHPIASWMVALDWGDDLTLQRRPDDHATTFDRAWCASPQAGPERSEGPDDSTTAPTPIDWPLPGDLAFRAHALLEHHVGRPLPVHATLRKRIPTGAGLGGGSSDAAAMLVGLTTLFDLQFDTPTLTRLAATLGSDVPFLVHALSPIIANPQAVPEPASGGALVTGRGEIIEPLPALNLPGMVLILPPLHCPTAAVYRAFDALPAPPPVDAARIRRLAAASPLDPTALFNDLAEPAMRTTPALRDAHARVAAIAAPHVHAGLRSGPPVHVTGSGAAMFCLAPTADEAQSLAGRIAAATGFRTVATRAYSPRG